MKFKPDWMNFINTAAPYLLSVLLVLLSLKVKKEWIVWLSFSSLSNSTYNLIQFLWNPEIIKNDFAKIHGEIPQYYPIIIAIVSATTVVFTIYHLKTMYKTFIKLWAKHIEKKMRDKFTSFCIVVLLGIVGFVLCGEIEPYLPEVTYPFLEEFVKAGIPLTILTYWTESKTKKDYLTYAIASSIGFALIENTGANIQSLPYRIVLTNIMHVCATTIIVMTAYNYRKYLIPSFFYASTLHLLFNGFISPNTFKPQIPQSKILATLIWATMIISANNIYKNKKE